MFVFRKIWRALFSWNNRFKIRLFALLPTISSIKNILYELGHKLLNDLKVRNIRKFSKIKLSPKKYFCSHASLWRKNFSSRHPLSRNFRPCNVCTWNLNNAFLYFGSLFIDQSVLINWIRNWISEVY